jgi:U4/U6.U5 tri-snRNP-associated protein 2
VHRFGILLRKLWSPHNYRNLVTPHELLQEVTLRSEKKFKIGSKGDPLEFLSWFLNTLHADLTADKKRGKSIVHDCFQGRVHVTSEREQLVEEASAQTTSGTQHNAAGPTAASGEGGEKKKRRRVKQNVVTERETPFLYLSLDIPPPPLFKDEAERNIIAQEPIFTLLNKFDGHSVQYIAATNEKKKYRLTALPKYIVFAIKRFTNNAFFMEKNPTIVNFPIKNLDLADCTCLSLNLNMFVLRD